MIEKAYQTDTDALNMKSDSTLDTQRHRQFPPWLVRPVPKRGGRRTVEYHLRHTALPTVCEEAKCPNRGECFARKTATFLALGKYCSRACRFCGVQHGTPDNIDQTEPQKIAQTVTALGLRYVVITSVTRDDLEDGGAGHFAAIVAALRKTEVVERIEVLIPDFCGRRASLETVCTAGIDVLNHNVETIPRLYPAVRPQASFQRSCDLLWYSHTHSPSIKTKSGFMVGLGESDTEVFELLDTLKAHGCDIVTIGQYLRPTAEQIPVQRFVTPEQFDSYVGYAESIGIAHTIAGTYVRSSYHAEEVFQQSIGEKREKTRG
jgi:lipoic acid synthetase